MSLLSQLCNLANNLDEINLIKEANIISSMMRKIAFEPNYLNDVLANDIDASYVDGLKTKSDKELKDMLHHHQTYPSSQAEFICIQNEIKERKLKSSDNYDAKIARWISSLSDPQLISATIEYRTKNPLDKSPILDALNQEIEKRELGSSMGMHSPSFNPTGYAENLHINMNDQEYNQSHLNNDH